MRLLWVDHETRVVVRSKRTAVLSINQFAIFRLLAARKRMNSRELWDAVYVGASNPPGNPSGTVRAAVFDMNAKLARLHVLITAQNHGNKSFYQMVDLHERPQHKFDEAAE